MIIKLQAWYRAAKVRKYIANQMYVQERNMYQENDQYFKAESFGGNVQK